MVIKMLTGKKLQGGFTLIELIASMVLMAIMLPSVGLLVVNSMRAIATHNVSLQASVMLVLYKIILLNIWMLLVPFLMILLILILVIV